MAEAGKLIFATSTLSRDFPDCQSRHDQKGYGLISWSQFQEQGKAVCRIKRR